MSPEKLQKLLLDNPLMPQPINCDICGDLSTVHNVQYVYQRVDEGNGDNVPQHELKKVVAVIECRKCGVRTQTIDTADK